MTSSFQGRCICWRQKDRDSTRWEFCFPPRSKARVFLSVQIVDHDHCLPVAHQIRTTGEMNDLGIREILFGYICPTLGCLMATAMFAGKQPNFHWHGAELLRRRISHVAFHSFLDILGYVAPIHDLRDALLMGRLGCLNPLPWAFLTGNCLGWCAYGYYTHDPFILATNLPGLVLSFWLNHGAIKLQYVEYRDYRSDDMVDIQVAPIQVGMREENTRPSNTTNHLSESMILVPQEVWFFRILILWSTVLVWVGWIMPLISPSPNTWVKAATIVGLLVNLNLIFFYGAPLQSIFRVIQTKQSNSIHLMTMYMSCLNCTFWTGYGKCSTKRFLVDFSLIRLTHFVVDCVF